MKTNTILLLLTAGLILLLCGCGAAKTPAPDSPSQPTQSESGGKPLDITSFYFSHTASSTDGCYCLQLALEESGTHLYAEELFSGGRIVDTMIEDNVLEQLGEVMGTYHVDRWDGFDKKSKHVLDGSRFTLSVTLADGSTISARGSNSFPENYSDVHNHVQTLYAALMEQYASSDDEPICGGHTEREDPNAPKTIASTEISALSARFFCLDVDDPSQGSHYAFQILPDDNEEWVLSCSVPVEGSAPVDESVMHDIQSLINTYDLVRFNGLYSVTSGLPPEFSPAFLSVDYASGEHLEFTVDGDPDFLWCAAFKELLLNILSTEGVDAS